MPKFTKSITLPQPLNPPIPLNNETIIYGDINGLNSSTVNIPNKSMDVAGSVVPFSFSSGNKIFIGKMPNTLTISNVVVEIINAFDNVLCTISIGDDLQNESLMGSNLNDPNTIGSYEADPNYRYSIDTDVYLYINGVNTIGSGLARLYFN